jgi:hypothetical protein
MLMPSKAPTGVTALQAVRLDTMTTLSLVVTAISLHSVRRRNMPTDSDRPLAVQPSFAPRLASSVVKDLPVVHEYAVGNQLLVTGILFNFVPRPKTGVSRIEQRRQVTVHIGVETLKVPEFLKQQRRHHQDMFNGRFRSSHQHLA